jgi:hypothetical protein
LQPRARRRLPVVAVIGVAAGIVALLWWLTREDRKSDAHVFGPYSFPVALEWTVGVILALVGLGSTIWIGMTARRWYQPTGLGVLPAVLIVLAAAYTTLAWRGLTNSYNGDDGADIGAGILALISPAIIWLLLIVAIAVQHNNETDDWPGRILWASMVMLLGVGLYVFVFFAPGTAFVA